MHGRGAADGAWGIFSVFTAIKNCQEQEIPHPTVIFVLSTEHESGNKYLDELLDLA